MEPNTQDASHAQLMGLASFSTALIATIMVCNAIVGHWQTFRWLEKGMAGVLVLNMAIFPCIAIFRNKTWGKRLEAAGAQNVSLAYSWLLLAAMLFNRF